MCFKGRRGCKDGCVGIGYGRKGVFGCGVLWVSIFIKIFFFSYRKGEIKFDEDYICLYLLLWI